MAAELTVEEELLKKKEIKSDFKNKTFFEKLKYVRSNITVEPIFAGLIIPSMLARLAVQNLNLDKACRVKLGLGDEICDALIERKGNLSDYERETQKVISSIEAWRSIVSTAIPTVLVIFMGAWSDRTGNRKACILLPIIGEFLVCICNIISTIFFYEIPVEVTMFFEVIFPAITGGWVMIFLGVFSYIGDITTEETRTFRVGLVNLCLTAGIPIGTALSGIMLKWLGYYGIFTISGSIYLFTFVYGMITLKSCTKQKIDVDKQNTPVKLSDIWTLLKETVDVAFKKRHNNLRAKIILTLTIIAIAYGPNHGERIVMYLYVRYKLKWDAMMYSIYSTYSVIAHSLGALFSISVFSRRLGFHDSVLCIISLASKLAGSVFLSFVLTDTQMFMVPLVEILNATTFTSLRSMASKFVTSEEMGKMNSLMSLVETLAALLFEPTYSGLYFATLPIFSGAVFLFSGAMTLPALAILIWIFAQHRKELRKEKKAAIQNNIEDTPAVQQPTN